MADGARDDDQQPGRRQFQDRNGDRRDVGGGADEAALSARLKRLGQGLDRLGAGAPESPRGSRGISDPTAFGRAMKLSAELVGGVVFGAGFGLLIDHAFGTSPWGIITLLMLGFAGGVLSVMRSVGVISSNRARSDGET